MAKWYTVFSDRAVKGIGSRSTSAKKPSNLRPPPLADQLLEAAHKDGVPHSFENKFLDDMAHDIKCAEHEKTQYLRARQSKDYQVCTPRASFESG